jgi:hypothetical protein
MLSVMGIAEAFHPLLLNAPAAFNDVHSRIQFSERVPAKPLASASAFFKNARTRTKTEPPFSPFCAIFVET